MYAPPPPPQPKSNNNVLWIVLGVLAVCGVGGVAIMAAILFPVFSQAKLAAKKTLALSHAKQMSTALIMYSIDNNDLLPPAAQWMDVLGRYEVEDQIFKSPEATPNDPTDYGFAFRTDLQFQNLEKMQDNALRVMVFDSTLLSRNAHSGLETVPSPGRYGKGTAAGNTFGFADGHAKFVRDMQYPGLHLGDSSANRESKQSALPR